MPAGKDFYYGDLQHRLSARGVSALVVCGDALGTDRISFAKSQLSAEPPYRLPELCLAPLWAPIRIAGHQMASSLRLAAIAMRTAPGLAQSIAMQAAHDCLQPDAAANSLVYWIAWAAVRQWRPQAFITFYEGHSWERCAWLGAKAADSGCATVGYQHAMIFREALAVLKPVMPDHRRLIPDAILTLGEAAAELLKPGHDAYGVELVPFGSFRYRDSSSQGPADPSRRTVLISPTGLEPEAGALFAFAAACARLLPRYRFIFRMFPGVALPGVETAVHGYANELSNIEISDRKDIYDDYAQASIVLYRGSSSVLHAVLSGLLPVYVDVAKLLDTDPLFMLKRWKRVCASPEAFVELAQDHEQGAIAAREEEWSAAAGYLRRYAGPVNERSIDGLLNAIQVKP
jgi:hypothetical protein